MPFLRASLVFDPAMIDALFCLAEEAAFRRVLCLDPMDAATFSNLGTLLRDRGRLSLAGDCFRFALVSRPGLAEGLNNLGNLAQELGDARAAAGALERAVAVAPGRAEAWNSLGNARLHLGQRDPAERCYRQAIRYDSRSVKAHCHLGSLLEQAGRWTEALASYEAALALDQRAGTALSGAAHLRRRLCDWSRYRLDETALREAVRAGAGDISPFVFTTIDSTMEEQQLCARQWVRDHYRGITPLPSVDHWNKRIRLGYLSADFYEHATAYLAAELFELHDRDQFEVFAYSWGETDHSPMRRRLEAAFDHFVDISNLSYEAAARRIRADGIDILIDLKGYTQHARTQILAWRPAPVQVNFLGFPGSMGAPFIDAIIADPIVLPLDQQPFVDERIVTLPDCYQVNDRQRRIAGETPSRTDCGLPKRGLVFAAFNNSYKLTPPMFDIWMRLLAAVPDSVLWLLAAGDVAEDNLRREAAVRGVSSDRSG